MSSIITLTTDFGSRDGYAGAMKGRILSICPSANIVDITHSIPPQSIVDAAFCLLRAAPVFPAGSIHVAVIDPTVGSQRKALLVQTENFYLLGPDNGIFSLILDVCPPRTIMEIFPRTETWQAHSSFDGLELFAPAAACLAKGMKLEDMGKTIDHYRKISLPEASVVNERITGEIILFDKFGNAVTNIQGSQISEMKKKIVSLNLDGREMIIPLRNHYSQNSEKQGDETAIINSDGLLELSIFKGSIRQKYNLERGQSVKVIRNS